jgi:hypothetical protein
MDIMRYFDRVQAMDSYIQRRATGTPEQFADKMGLSRSTLMEYIRLMKALNAPIEYDSYNMTYHYVFQCKLFIGFESKYLDDRELKEVNKKSLKNFCSQLLIQE